MLSCYNSLCAHVRRKQTKGTRGHNGSHRDHMPLRTAHLEGKGCTEEVPQLEAVLWTQLFLESGQGENSPFGRVYVFVIFYSPSDCRIGILALLVGGHKWPLLYMYSHHNGIWAWVRMRSEVWNTLEVPQASGAKNSSIVGPDMLNLPWSFHTPPKSMEIAI